MTSVITASTDQRSLASLLNEQGWSPRTLATQADITLGTAHKALGMSCLGPNTIRACTAEQIAKAFSRDASTIVFDQCTIIP